MASPSVSKTTLRSPSICLQKCPERFVVFIRFLVWLAPCDLMALLQTTAAQPDSNEPTAPEPMAANHRYHCSEQIISRSPPAMMPHSVGKQRPHLLCRDRRKLCQIILCRPSPLQRIKQGLNRHPRPRKTRRTALNLGIDRNRICASHPTIIPQGQSRKETNPSHLLHWCQFARKRPRPAPPIF